uniref:Uncharacterized protein n=1 Tax=Peronospora matthiolae TaxID=2874970 RepID=A0AAV1UYF8_9STRA
MKFQDRGHSSPLLKIASSSRGLSTLMWLLACTCCFALGLIVSYTNTSSLSLIPFKVLETSRWLRTRPSTWQSLSHASSATTLSISHDEYARGIILCLHNGIVAMGVSLIRELRCLGNLELIQVYHCLPTEMSDESRALLTRNDARVKIIDVCTDILAKTGAENLFGGKVEKAKKFKNYWVKPLALYHTKLREVI